MMDIAKVSEKHPQRKEAMRDCKLDPAGIRHFDNAETQQLLDRRDKIDILNSAHMDLMKSLRDHVCPGRAAPADTVSAKQCLQLVRFYSLLNNDRDVVQTLVEHRAPGIADPDITYCSERWQILRFGFPMFMFMVCFAAQSFGLHIATHFYIKYMDAQSAMVEASTAGVDPAAGVDASDLHMIREGQLLDAVGDWIGTYANPDSIPLAVLDASGGIPAFGFMLIYGYARDRCVDLWTKVFLVASCMALSKAVLDMVTVLPDSSGWTNCQARLDPDGVIALRDLDFSVGFAQGMLDLLVVETIGVEGVRGRVRYCSDMMISGHTYFAVVFSMAVWSLLRYEGYSDGARWATAFLCILCVIIEMGAVIVTQFHYTVDLVASVFMVIFLWDSIHLESLAYEWVWGFKNASLEGLFSRVMLAFGGTPEAVQEREWEKFLVAEPTDGYVTPGPRPPSASDPAEPLTNSSEPSNNKERDDRKLGPQDSTWRSTRLWSMRLLRGDNLMMYALSLELKKRPEPGQASNVGGDKV
mmetsp:Transcript_51974/g.118584  ORF Transcript_51974/g.118584 Transcript_51974/m.118584 type:complete len:526 (+) Transcript_51974:3-1580(+)